MTYLEHAFRFLEQYEGLLVVFALDEVEGGVGELGEDDGDLVLVHLDLFVVHLIKRVTFLGAKLITGCTAFCVLARLLHWKQVLGF